MFDIDTHSLVHLVLLCLTSTDNQQLLDKQVVLEHALKSSKEEAWTKQRECELLKEELVLAQHQHQHTRGNGALGEAHALLLAQLNKKPTVLSFPSNEQDLVLKASWEALRGHAHDMAAHRAERNRIESKARTALARRCFETWRLWMLVRCSASEDAAFHKSHIDDLVDALRQERQRRVEVQTILEDTAEELRQVQQAEDASRATVQRLQESVAQQEVRLQQR